MAAQTRTQACLNGIEIHKTESVASASSTSSSDSSLSTASGRALLTLSKSELDRLIAENMTSVLKTLKKRKHAKKHARLRHAAAAAEEATQLHTDKQEEQESNGPSVQTGVKMNGKEKKESHRKSNKSGKSRKNNGRKDSVLAVSDAETNLSQHSLKEVQPDMKHESTASMSPYTNGACNGQSVEKTGKENKTINAFQLMMKARFKSIGSNSPGKEREVREVSPSQQLAREKKAIRNLQLEQWAAQKGAGKRRLQEEAEENYIDHQMKKRAKRLKKLLGNMIGEVKKELTEETVEEVLEIPDTPIVGEVKKGPKEELEEVLEILDSPVRSKVGSAKHNSISNEIKTEAVNVSGSKKRGRPRKNTVAATVEKPAVKEEIIKVEDGSDEEFQAQLSTPRKKKDSLLGYFAKVTPELNTQSKCPSMGKGQKASPPSNTTPRADEIRNETDVDTPSAQGSSRPRRSCANRIKDYSAFEKYSPAKEEQKPVSTKPSIVTPLKIINVQSPNAMRVVKSPALRMFSSGGLEEPGNRTVSASEWPSTPKSVKLAPVFVRTLGGKSQPPPQQDPEKLRARQQFLMSGIPEKLRQEMEKRTQYEEHILNESSVFPLVSHVMQEENSLTPSYTREHVNFARSCIKLRPDQVETPPGKGSPKSGKIQLGMFTACSEEDYDDAIDKCVQSIDVDSRPPEDDNEEDELPEVQNQKDIVRDYKQRFPHFPVFRCYKQFRAAYQDHLQQTQGEKSQEQSSEPDASQHHSLDESVEIIETTKSCRNGETLFTEKYKPLSTEQILINFSPANMLTQFLSLWKDDTGSQKRTFEATSQNGHYFLATDKNDDDFLLSNDSNSSTNGLSGPGTNVCNHIVLVGPPGCGKTSNVYAVANEMNFNVLELNASSRRKGKIILQELQEATQSHQVRQKSERFNSTDGTSVTGTQNQKGRKKNGLNGVFSCLERRPSVSESNGNNNGSKKLSLILVEDADIVFEQDDGFLGAINSLIATSKRPIVLTTTNPSCAHMARYMSRNNVIRYVAPGIGNVAKLFSLLALVERIPIDQHDIGRLYAHNGKDMRKTLNELQFFIQSGGDMERFAGGVNGHSNHLQTGDSEELNAGLNETREEEEDGEQMGDSPDRTVGRKKGSKRCQKVQLAKHHHSTLYELFTRNQNESVLLRIPLDFNVLWCNMELVLRTAKILSPPVNEKGKRTGSGGKRGKRGSIVQNEAKKQPDELLLDELSVLYENVSRAEAGWGVTHRNRIRYGKDVQDEQQQQQLAHDIGHALVEGSWIDWFSQRTDANSPTKRTKKSGNGEKGIGAKAYDALRKLEQEPRQTIASYIGVNGIRSRVTVCDYEPFLRQICRHERDRSSTERRGSRFYHYLRNFASAGGTVLQPIVTSTTMTTTAMMMKPASGFSVDHFDTLSHCFEETPVQETTLVDQA
uniref:AAA+ ATPase domain-containing protein n=1 Tax=Anopheles culicifacies TaxID=139723 RepID=A0A182MJZ8_9DIPT